MKVKDYLKEIKKDKFAITTLVEIQATTMSWATAVLPTDDLRNGKLVIDNWIVLKIKKYHSKKLRTWLDEIVAVPKEIFIDVDWSYCWYEDFVDERLLQEGLQGIYEED